MTRTDAPPWPARPALFLDLDGTLVEIRDHPDDVEASASLLALLPRLQRAVDGAIAVITGRRLEDVDRILAPHAFAAAAVHGLQRRDGRGRIESHRLAANALEPLRHELEDFAAAHAGLWLEDKRFSLALHYRRRPDLEPCARRFAADLESRLPPRVELLRGRKVVELKPALADKGQAIAAFMGEPPFAGRTPLFVGDDVTDETGFRAVNALAGVAIKVGPGATAAPWRLPNVAAVLEWLEQCIQARGLGPDGAAQEPT